MALVAWGFPPSRHSSVYRGLAIANALVAAGARVTVVTADEGYFRLVTGIDRSLIGHVDPTISVLRAPYPPGRMDPVINRWPHARVQDRATFLRDEQRREHTYFPERLYGPWRPALEHAMHRLHRDDPIHLVVAIGTPYASYAAAGYLHSTFGVPYVLDDRDGWLLNVYTGEERTSPPGIADWLSALTSTAIESWYVNPPIADWHRQRFPDLADRIHVVENGWDQALLDVSATSRLTTGPPAVGFIGTINTGFPMRHVLEGWRAARGVVLPPDAELHLFGPLGFHATPGRHLHLLADTAAMGVVLRGPYPKAEIANAYAELDVLLFAKEGGEMVTSGKVYEYTATGKPIAVAADPVQDARRVLATYPRAHLASDTSAGEVARVLGEAWADAVTCTPERLAEAQAVGAGWERGAVLRPAVDRVLSRVAGSVVRG